MRAEGDFAFLHGAIRVVMVNEWYDETFIRKYTFELTASFLLSESIIQ